MTATIVDRAITFEVASPPPARLAITLRACWRKPPEDFDLELVREDLDVAYYEIAEE